MDYEQVSNSQLNLSLAKQMYSFPRSQRFRNTNPEEYKSPYAVPAENGALTDRSTTFGRESRNKIDHKTYMPPPGAYNIKSQFSPDKKKGYGFGYSLRKGFQKDKSIPGPGSYTSRMLNKQIGYSFGKEKLNHNKGSFDATIGPGAYFNGQDRFRSSLVAQSKHKSPSFGRMGKEQRFSGSRCRVSTPGPGSCIGCGNLDSTYFDIYCKYKVRPGASFGRSKRMRTQVSHSPGPSEYTLFSQFARINKSSLS